MTGDSVKRHKKVKGGTVTKASERRNREAVNSEGKNSKERDRETEPIKRRNISQ